MEHGKLCYMLSVRFDVWRNGVTDISNRRVRRASMCQPYLYVSNHTTQLTNVVFLFSQLRFYLAKSAMTITVNLRWAFWWQQGQIVRNWLIISFNLFDSLKKYYLLNKLIPIRALIGKVFIGVVNNSKSNIL